MKRHVKKVLEHLMGPTGSILIHAAIIVALVKLVFFETAKQDPEVEVVMMEVEEADLEEIKKELKELEQIEMVDAIAPPDVSMETEAPPEEVEEFDTAEPDVDFEALEMVDSVQSPLKIQGLYAGRSSAGRKSALGRHAGKWAKFTEAAVLRALEWLKANQNADGSWDRSARSAMTGLGLLTFLAHGETPTSERYGETVEKAIRWLVDNQREDGMWPDAGAHTVYGHGIATYAVCEAYGLTLIPSLKQTMDRSVKVIVDGQQAGGGWDYEYRKTPRRDTSVSGWQIQALKAATIAHCDVPGLKAALDKAVTDLKWAQSDLGRFGYTDPGSGNIGLTGVGVLCMQLLGYADDEACERGIEYLMDQNLEVVWSDEVARWPLYSYYYITQAKFHHGRSWNSWNNQFARVYTRTQNEDGSWTPPGNEESRGKVYGTTFAALTLQVYYRLLPTYQQEAVETRPPAAVEEEEEDLFDIS